MRWQQSRWIGLALSVALLLSGVQVAQAQRAKADPNDPEPPTFQRRSGPEKHEPIVLTADEVTYDAETEVVTATGRVEVTQKDPVAGGDRTLRADRLIYDRKQDVVRAIGNVVLIENQGDPKQPAFVRKGRIECSGGEVNVGGDAGPTTADWDGDGRWDLIVGGDQGKVVWYRNVGKKTRPKFEAGVDLVSGGGHGSLESGAEPKAPAARLKVHCTDWNGEVWERNIIVLAQPV